MVSQQASGSILLAIFPIFNSTSLLIAAIICFSPPSFAISQPSDIELKIDALEDVVVKLVATVEKQSSDLQRLQREIGNLQAKNDSQTQEAAQLKKNRGNQNNILRVGLDADVDATYRRIVEAVSDRNYAFAEKQALALLEAKPTASVMAMVQFWLGEIRMVYGDHTMAKEYYQNALSVAQDHPKAPDIMLKLAVIAFEHGETAEADTIIAKLMKSHPKSTAAHLAATTQKKYKAVGR